MEAGDYYQKYRYRTEKVYSTADLNNVLGWLALALPLLIAMWRGDKEENRFGPVPAPVEHLTASRFIVAILIGATITLVPTSIYAGLFQPGVWVGRGESAPSMPLIDSNSEGRLFAKCWNLKGVGAGTGEGPLSGVYRDGYGGSVLDFVVSGDGQLDVVPAGETLAKAYRADGFDIHLYGLAITDGQVIVGGQSRFLIAAVYDGDQLPDGNINFTTFSFAKTGEIWPEWQVIMTTGMNLGQNPLTERSEQARGRLMVGDCIVR